MSAKKSMSQNSEDITTDSGGRNSAGEDTISTSSGKKRSSNTGNKKQDVQQYALGTFGKCNFLLGIFDMHANICFDF